MWRCRNNNISNRYRWPGASCVGGRVVVGVHRRPYHYSGPSTGVSIPRALVSVCLLGRTYSALYVHLRIRVYTTYAYTYIHTHKDATHSRVNCRARVCVCFLAAQSFAVSPAGTTCYHRDRPPSPPGSSTIVTQSCDSEVCSSFVRVGPKSFTGRQVSV